MPNAHDAPFQLEEATITELHDAIRAGNTTVVQVVQKYIDRAKAYNGVASLLLTEDGAPVPAAVGTVRATAPLRFPTDAVKASTILPDLDKYKGVPLQYGTMESTASNPSEQQQVGMIVGKPNAGQVNAIGTFNIRGERSVTCKGDYDLHPSLGALPKGAPPACEFFRQQPAALPSRRPRPKGAPPACEFFRQQPDALERAAELDAEFGRNPDLDKMPMYGVVFSFKDPFDTSDMRSTGGGGVPP